MDSRDSEWTKKGGTLSDKSAQKEFGLAREEIIEAIRAGKLQYRQNHMHGNPYLRLLRSEVEAFVQEKYGDNYAEIKRLQHELAQVNKQLRSYKSKSKTLEKRKKELESLLKKDAA